MKKKKSLLAAFVVAIAFALSTIVAYGQGAVRILDSQAGFRFAGGLSFSLVAETDEAIEGVTLYYRRQDERVTRRAVLEFTPGPRVEASYEHPLEPGEIPPGTTIEYYWRFDLADGTHIDSDPLTFVYEDDRFAWVPLQSGNITILYYGDESDAALARRLADAGQTTLARLQTEIGVALEKPVRVYVYHTDQDMQAALSPRSEGYDERVLTLGVAVADDALLLLGSHPDVRQTLSHELSHIVVGLATENPYAPLPRWLDEGLAMYAEGQMPPGNTRALRQAVERDALISIRSLSAYTGDAGQVDLYYGETFSLVEFMLNEYGRDKMGQLLQVFKEGTLPDDALQQVYGLSIDRLEEEWRKSLGLSPRGNPARAATADPARRSEQAGSTCPGVALIGVLGAAVVLSGKGVGIASRGDSGDQDRCWPA